MHCRFIAKKIIRKINTQTGKEKLEMKTDECGSHILLLRGFLDFTSSVRIEDAAENF